MSDEFDMTEILGEFGITPVKLDEPKPKKEPVRRKRIVAKAEPKETLITRVEEMREADAESVRKLADSLKGKKVAKVKAFLKEIVKKTHPKTYGGVLEFLVKRGWTIPKGGVMASSRYSSSGQFLSPPRKANLILSPDKSKAYAYHPELVNSDFLDSRGGMVEEVEIGKGPYEKKGDVWTFDAKERPFENLVWLPKKNKLKS
jgi:hypothetical protein